ncbi:hypothetical protein Ksed_22910 [Kytococcus sedentarius DSM 20547]|uniref:Uncharacterized protein n=1 Tax=Kytococcus sedentarius (strain ATCC 14392 / DSM 20547 / JCM 11482 / CCUG 33030 / NBRC 15357 / NCTC 11040 / CCM 314 / 541) TaxID=478801 RepID=C7NM19_KYTSD|nr:hypothetical protein Ksed_22910 [Kytococcus sedentarius DSM 20547]
MSELAADGTPSDAPTEAHLARRARPPVGWASGVVG